MDEKTAYDKVPYQTSSFPETHPDHLATLAKLFGVNPTDIRKARVLELGCARGENLIPLALALPESHFIGIDLSSAQIADGNSTVTALGLKNIELKHMNILDIGPNFGTFDYIITHGIFSWVPKAVQEKILEVSCVNLAPNGIAYLSYNTYPGWHMRGVIRDIMLYHAKQFSNPNQYVAQGRAFLKFAAESLKNYTTPYSQMIQHELSLVNEKPDWYLFHDHLEEVNEPVYFHQLAESALKFGLQYLSDTPFSSMLLDGYPKEVKEVLQRIAPDLIRMEQYKDFLLNRHFRRSLFCRKELVLARNVNSEIIKDLYIGGRIDFGNAVINDGSEVECQALSGKRVRVQYAPFKLALKEISAEWPRWLSFQELVNRITPLVSERDFESRLATNLLSAYAQEVVELHSYPAPFTSHPNAHPCVSPLVRLQAERGNIVTNLRHESVCLDQELRELVSKVDGTKEAIELLSELPGHINGRRALQVMAQYALLLV